MIETGTNSPQSFKPFAFLDDMYNWSTAEFGYPMEFHLFDDRLAEALDLSWLREQVCPHLVSDDELEKIVESGVLKSCATQGGSPGFLLYTPEQIKTYEELRALQRY